MAYLEVLPLICVFDNNFVLISCNRLVVLIANIQNTQFFKHEKGWRILRICNVSNFSTTFAKKRTSYEQKDGDTFGNFGKQ